MRRRLRKLGAALGLLANAGPAPTPSPRRGDAPGPAAPSQWLRQHGPGVEPPQIDEHHFRPFYRRRTRLDRLLAAGAIDPGEWSATIAYRNLHEVAYGPQLRARMPDGTGRSAQRHGTGLVPGERTLAAIERLRYLKGQLEEVASMLLELLIIQEQCWAKIGEHFGVSAKTAKSWCLAAVKRLGEILQ